MKNPVFSIITVTYNAQNTLETTIKSVLEQNYPHIEYIIIDGCSTDNTLRIVDKYRERISKIISEKDNGIYNAMNKGLALATGDYVWYLNAGDSVYSTDTVQFIVNQLDVNKYPDIIYGETAIVDGNNNFMYMRRLQVPHQLSWRNFKNGMLVSHQSFIVKRDIAPLFDVQYKFSSDFDWCIRCLQKAELIMNTNIILTNYLNEGVTTQNRKASLKERFKIMCHYYGKTSTYLRHIWFALRFGIAKITGKP